MKIKLDRILIGPFSLREKMDEEHLNAIADSFKVDGQWDPIIVRPRPDGNYELISGEYRVRAALKLGWNEIEATVKDLDDIEAGFLALKTNIIRQSLTELEEGTAIRRYMTEYELTQKEIAEKLGRSEAWVSKRLALVLKIAPEVREALLSEEITLVQATIISQISPKEGKLMPYFIDRQKKLLELLLQRQRSLGKRLSEEETRDLLKWFQNDTIYTIGYNSKDLDELIGILKENKIYKLVDVRESGKSRYRPEFNEDILGREFKKTKIVYERRPDLGVVYDIRTPYIEGWLSDDCFKQWYKWSVSGRRVEGKVRNLIPELVKDFKSSGRVCLMCEERYPQPKGSQKHYCHRDILTNMILQYEDKEEPLMKFEKRVDL